MVLAREVNAQRMRQAAGEAFVDDVMQKMAINRAVFAAGYGIDPRPYAAPADPQSRIEPAPVQQQPPATTSLAQKLAPWLVGAALLGGGATLPSLFQRLAAPSAPAAVQVPPAAAADQYDFGLMPPVSK